MNRTLQWCAKEWRGQRNVLAAYLGLGCISLAAVFAMVSDGFWNEPGSRTLLVAAFLALGTLGVVAFAAPQLARDGLGPKEDLLAQRLPLALLPAYLGLREGRERLVRIDLGTARRTVLDPRDAATEAAR